MFLFWTQYCMCHYNVVKRPINYLHTEILTSILMCTLSHCSCPPTMCSLRVPQTIHQLPIDIVRHQLLTFLNTKSAVKLTQTSHFFFNTLRHRIRRTYAIAATVDHFIQQSDAHSKHIGVHQFVRTQSKSELNLLIQHITNQQIIKVGPLSCCVIDFNEHLENIVLPANLHTICFEWTFNQLLNSATLPSNLHTLIFGVNFNQALDQVTLPSTLHTLIFGRRFNQSLKKVTLPTNLHKLLFGHSFNQALDQVTLPPNLHTLSFGNDFNQSLDEVTLPKRLHTLAFGCYFNQSFKQFDCPTSLRILCFGWFCKQTLIGVKFPEGLQIIMAGKLVQTVAR